MQCKAERDVGPGCGYTYCILESGHDGKHQDYKGKEWI